MTATRTARRLQDQPGRGLRSWLWPAAAALALICWLWSAAGPAAAVTPVGQSSLRVDVVGTGFSVVWEMRFLPDGKLLVAEQNGGYQATRSEDRAGPRAWGSCR